jgi:hypothetical protein
MMTSETTAAKQSWIERLMGALLYPRSTFAHIREENAVRLCGAGGAALLVLFVFTLAGLGGAAVTSVSAACWSAVMSVIVGFSLWLSLSTLIAILAICFQRNPQNLRGAFVSLGWSFAPWLFMAPLVCYQHVGGSFFGFIASLLGLWVLVLQIVALVKSFEIELWQAALLVFVAPLVLCFFQMVQFAQALCVAFASMSG